MELFEIIKQFKMIMPDKAFTERSRRAVLASLPFESHDSSMMIFKTRRFIFRLLETGVALSLAGLFIVLITGGFSGSTISPVRFSAIDPQTLHAEAQAIDAQIELASLNYSEPAAVAESTQKLAAFVNKKMKTSSSTASSVSSSTDISSSTLSIDQALQELSQ